MLHLIDFSPVSNLCIISFTQNLKSPLLKLWNDGFSFNVHLNLVFKLIKGKRFLKQTRLTFLFLCAMIVDVCFYLSSLFYYLYFFRSSNHTPTFTTYYSRKGKEVVL
ncbi:MAG: hypothetical protein A3B99_02730 [Candidatus Yanofskybacteria bacterium RIFCSPHIGHO2_02_FULL_44_12b]|uniref:Uncharacterized protein n=1 Tax=Candidatus Yanofskybacteria bacterium RIFCSPLOWO2_01_FULL_44_22 TaxID=1802697 RepID=A0A1F8GPI7_9BACT|nr:MAG: hypothetical protein A3B99_02730 [Candidatus Yanofskybacteria bacterium RIFCSPHIGHO2_02_FULL_44_12b]OGN26349.1 MAG: hypothetical protein A2925_00460 [Candidatus Yanofskybacteria bacterium RIFCSPLOWO2_01_FULL_44_22]